MLSEVVKNNITECYGEDLVLRYELMKERIDSLVEDSSCGIYSNYIANMADFLSKVYNVYETLEEYGRDNVSLQQFKQWNDELYADIREPNYSSLSYANPDVAVERFGKELGQPLCFLYTELRALIPSAYQSNLFDLVIYSELFVEIQTLLSINENDKRSQHSDIKNSENDDALSQECKEEQKSLARELLGCIYSFERDYSEPIIKERIKWQIDSSYDFATRIIMDSDLSNDLYLYYYGEYIGENEIASYKYFSALSEEEVEAMAFTYTDGYREGFKIAGIDLTKKQTVNIRYQIGFERMVRAAVKQFEKLGLKPTIYPAAVKSIDRTGNVKVGYTASSVNKQYDYDHRFDRGLYLDKAYMERHMEVLKSAYEENKELCKVYAGPACIEVFGENEFNPVNKASAISLTEEQQKLSIKQRAETGRLSNRYIPQDECSFTIIAYPVKEIGPCYEEIFRETVKVNNLDKKKYQSIQQHLIDALDEAVFVHVKGTNGNTTDIKVMLHEKEDSDKQTNFENCLADVNIPVGEVFTSPKLTGTYGTLNVSSAYLNDMDYKNLTIIFKDGKIASYDCDNFDTDEENKSFIKENLLNHRDTLPLGEFAIGTNTTAYAMAKKFDILHKLPILIVEKMGPHFAIGDTCYSHMEEMKLYNPDGKEIVAKENECSMLRNIDEEKAYFNTHTDITIPYEEIGIIEAIHEDGSSITLLKDGKFVLKGTEDLNMA